MSKKLKILLLSSLILNIFLMGLFGGQFLHDTKEERFPREEKIMLGASKLPPQILEEIKTIKKENRKRRKESRELRKKVFEVLSAETFDEEAYRTEMRKLHQIRLEMKEKQMEASIRLAKELTPEQRKIMGGMLRRHPHHREGKRHGNGRH